MNNELKSIKDIDESDLYNFLLLINEEIVPPISNRISLKDYPVKIKSLSIGKVVVSKGVILGLSVYYPPNKDDDYIYLTLLAVNRNNRGTNLGKLLIEEMINTAKTYKSKGIKTQTWSTATKLISYYKTFGFETYSIKDNRGLDVKSVLLKLVFQ